MGHNSSIRILIAALVTMASSAGAADGPCTLSGQLRGVSATEEASPTVWAVPEFPLESGSSPSFSPMAALTVPAEVDPAGNFSIELSPPFCETPSWQLIAVQGPRRSADAVVEVQPGKKVTAIQLRLAPSSALEVQAMDGRTRAPLRQCALVASPMAALTQRAAEAFIHHDGFSTKELAAGKFRISPVQPGPTHVKLMCEGYMPQETLIRLRAGKTNRVTLSLGRHTTIAGRVLDAAGNPVTGKSVRADPTQARCGHALAVESDSDGRFAINGLAEGCTYELQVGLQGAREPLATATSAITAPASAIELRLAAPPSAASQEPAREQPLPHWRKLGTADTEGVSRSLLEADLGVFAYEARIIPEFEKGKQVGYRLFSFAPDSIFRQLGLEERDIILRINGTPLNGQAAPVMAQAMKELAQRETLEVELMRNGKRLQKVWKVR